MSLSAQVSAVVTRIGTEFKSVRSSIGVLGNLGTATKTDLVTALNEVNAGVPRINDGATGPTTLWSSAKTNTSITDATAAVKADILGGVGSAWDTLNELRNTEITDENVIVQIQSDLGNRVRVDAGQAFNAGQKAQGQANLDVPSNAQVGDTNIDLVGVFNAALL